MNKKKSIISWIGTGFFSIIGIIYIIPILLVLILVFAIFEAFNITFGGFLKF